MSKDICIYKSLLGAANLSEHLSDASTFTHINLFNIHNFLWERYYPYFADG